MENISDYYKMHNLSKTLSNIFKSDLNKINSDDLLNFINIALESESDLLSLKKVIKCHHIPKCITLWDMMVYTKKATKHIDKLNGINE